MLVREILVRFVLFLARGHNAEHPPGGFHPLII